jgi:hypothetical protein
VIGWCRAKSAEFRQASQKVLFEKNVVPLQNLLFCMITRLGSMFSNFAYISSLVAGFVLTSM